MTITLNKEQMDDMKKYLLASGDVAERIPLPHSIADGYELEYLSMANLGDLVAVMYRWKRKE